MGNDGELTIYHAAFTIVLSNELFKIENELKFQLPDNLLLLSHLF